MKCPVLAVELAKNWLQLRTALHPGKRGGGEETLGKPVWLRTRAPPRQAGWGRDGVRGAGLVTNRAPPRQAANDGRTLASGGADSTILLWDLASVTQSSKSKSAPLGVAELDGLWSALAGDAAKADHALWTLAKSSKQALPFLKAQLRVVPAEAEHVAKLIADLDSPTFTVRQRAEQALEDLADAAEGAIRKTLQGSPTLEVRQRLEQILKKRDGEVLRRLRAIEAVEHMASPDARAVLETMAKTAPNPRLAEAAAAALARLDRRPH
jgi:hypothetical protein